MNVKLSKTEFQIKGVRENGKFKYRYPLGYDNKEYISDTIPREQIENAISSKEEFIEEGHEFEIRLIALYRKPRKKKSK